MNDVSRNIARLVFKYRWEELSDREQGELDGWIRQHPEHRVIFENLLKDKTNRMAWEELERYDDRKAFRKFLNRTGENRKLRYITVGVAVMLLSVVFVGVRFYGREKRIVPVKALANVKSFDRTESCGVVLTLEDGQKLSLKELRKSSVLKEREIRVDSSCVVYSRKEVSREMVYNSLEVPIGTEYSLVLSDGTRVCLNSQSRLTYPVVFDSKERVVELEGEAYFDVEEDAERPFLIKIRDAAVKVLGTSFNVKAYSDEGRIITTLVEGNVLFMSKAGEVLLRSGDQVCYDHNGSAWSKRRVDAELYTSWKEGTLKFENERLEDLLKVLKRWYGVEIFYTRPALKEQLYSGSLRRYEEIKNVLCVLEMTSDICFTVKNKTVIVK